MSRPLVVATAAVTVIGGAAAASAATPATMLAKSLKHSMQASYRKSYPGLEFAKVTCAIAKSETTARCQAHFTITSQRVVGVFEVSAKIDPATGGVHTKTLSITCKDSKTGAPVGC